MKYLKTCENEYINPQLIKHWAVESKEQWDGHFQFYAVTADDIIVEKFSIATPLEEKFPVDWRALRREDYRTPTDKDFKQRDLWLDEQQRLRNIAREAAQAWLDNFLREADND